jgi:hypothetical protein
MEGWRITCPVCGAALEDFRLYTRLFRADPRDALLVQIEDSARDGEQIMDRASTLRCGGLAHVTLMRSLLLPQAPRPRTHGPLPTVILVANSKARLGQNLILLRADGAIIFPGLLTPRAFSPFL